MSAEEETKPAGADNDHINLRVIGQNNSEVHFRIKKTTQMKKLKAAFCERQGIPINSVRFLFEGQRINDEQAPKDLEMEDNDTIEVYQNKLAATKQ
ncbi:small ubiquitin-related modifier 1-B-like isoform X2 [Bolinopsis microptera]|uniref:small ubiquitin-related modifier 1-B-like isoform X2 n=1 Tax=Bolinopsis microptera TaxID=2820187 RepID=UPI003078EFD1